jgi:hypothetical protein
VRHKQRKARSIWKYDPSIDQIREAYTYLTGQPFPDNLSVWDILDPIVAKAEGSMRVGLAVMSWFEANEHGTPVVMTY